MATTVFKLMSRVCDLIHLKDDRVSIIEIKTHTGSSPAKRPHRDARKQLGAAAKFIRNEFQTLNARYFYLHIDCEQDEAISELHLHEHTPETLQPKTQTKRRTSIQISSAIDDLVN